MVLEARLEHELILRARRRGLQRMLLPIGVAAVLFVVWHVYTALLSNALVPGPLDVAGAVPSVVSNPDVWSGLLSSDISLLIGFAAATLVGIPLGLLVGRVNAVDTVVGPMLDLAMVTPMIVMMPVVLVALGLTRQAQIVIIFIFSITLVVVPIRAGMRAIPQPLIDMTRSFGASEAQMWKEVFLPGSLPAVMTGVRMGFGQANLGMAAVELTMLAIGIGNVLLDLQSSFQKAAEFAVIGLIVVQSMIVMALMRMLEGQMTPVKNKGALGQELS
jgi:ABC-type nitrate/sulfonate/bicarbonate transport system permease component